MFYKLSKLIFVLFLFFTGWFQDVFFSIPYLHLVLCMCMLFTLIIHIMYTSEDITLTITKPVFLWLFFSFYLLVSGVFVAYDKVHLISSILDYMQNIILIIFIINISVIERNNVFFVRTYLIYSIVYMLTMLLYGYENGVGRLTLSHTSNPNSDALTLLMGVFCALILMKSQSLVKLVISWGIIGSFVYTIILTGSRKSFIAVIVMLTLWFLFVFVKRWKNYSVNKRLVSIFVILISIVVAISKFIPLILESSLYRRFTEGGFTIASDEIRSGMYQMAMQYFYENPIFGIGFNHFRILSPYKTYSHSTYGEVLSSTGLVGTVIYFTAYIIIILNLIYILIKFRGTLASIKAAQYIILMFIMLVLGTTVIHFYSIRDCLMLALMISFYITEKDKLNPHITSREN